jgi:hypothetical protein
MAAIARYQGDSTTSRARLSAELRLFVAKGLLFKSREGALVRECRLFVRVDAISKR